MDRIAGTIGSALTHKILCLTHADVQGSEQHRRTAVVSRTIDMGSGMASPRRKDSAPSKRPQPIALSGLSSRPAWQGHLRLSLVSCAVGLYKATTAASDISFNLINPETGNRIKMVTTDPDTGPVDRSTLVKGYAVEKNNYVLFSEEDFASVKL